MRDYVIDMAGVWVNAGEKAAYARGEELLKEMATAQASLDLQGKAMRALMQLLKERGADGAR